MKTLLKKVHIRTSKYKIVNIYEDAVNLIDKYNLNIYKNNKQSVKKHIKEKNN